MNWNQLGGELERKVAGKILLNEPMKNHTTWKIGGPADIVLVPAELSDVVIALKEAAKYGAPISVIGNGSNLLVKDKGVRGISIKINGCFNNVAIDNATVEAEVGISLPKLARLTADMGLTGLEFAIGIPATLGGAIKMNAGALGGEIGNHIQKILWADLEGNLHTSTRDELIFSYRHAVLPAEDIILLKAWIQLELGAKETIQELLKQHTEKRKKSQPINFPNAGSVFKNPPGNYAGKLIEEAGLKGRRIGDAQVSDIHANFIVNIGNATADDVLKLIDLVRGEVLKRYDIQLELEVQILGEA